MPPRIAVITPCYNEEAALPRYLEAVGHVLLDRTDAEYHVLMVDDGSTDHTWELIEAASRRDPRIRGLRLSRNFGSHVAETAGFDVVDADATVTLAADLQDPPETVVEFVDAWRKGAQVVWGTRLDRDEGRWRVLLSKVFLRGLRRLAMPEGSQVVTGGFLLVDRKVVDCIRAMREQNRVTFGLVAWTGFAQAQVPYRRRRRESGVSRWSVPGLLRTMYDALLGFSQALPRAITLFGLLCCLGALAASVVLLILAFAAPPMVSGWSSLVVMLTFLSGITFFFLGVVTEYLSRIYFEVTRRPLYFVAADTRDDPRGR